jgi:ribonuclease BN (tRNA processing enzyme)
VIRLQFLGSGDAFASGGRFQTCFYVDGGPEPMLLDCGATSLIALKRAGIDPASIGFVAVSHLHGDHFAGLPWLVLDGQFAKRTRPLVIAGPPSTRDRFERTFECLYPGATKTRRPFETRVLEYEIGAPCELGPATVTPFEVRHRSGAPSCALRIQYGGRVIAYSGDTEWTEALVDVAAGADLFVCECNFYDTKAPGHMDYATLMTHRAELSCDRIVLTHMSDQMLARASAVSGFECAADGAVVTI